MQPSAHKVLVSDPDEIVRALISHILRRAGYVVETVGDKAQLLRRIIAAEHDVIIADASAEGVADALRSAPERSRRVVLTTVREPQSPPPAYATLRKPLEFGELLDTVRDCLLQDA